MSDYKLIFKLKQHTPIIHFQHEQHGATLRASELKPKLDKFLIENSFGGILKFDSYREFLIGDTKSIEKGLKEIDNNSSIQDKENTKTEYLQELKLAFDYKLSISSMNSKRFLLGFPRKQYIKDNKSKIANYKLLWDNQFPNYFGNMKKEGEVKEPKEFIVNKKIIDGEIIVFDHDLRKRISDRLIEFFFLNNFGTRQNKGFGSFEVIEIEGVKPKLPEKTDEYPFFDINLADINMNTRFYNPNNSTYLPKSIGNKKVELKKKFNSLLKEKLYESENEIQYLFKIHNLFYRMELFYKTLRSGINIPNKLYFKSLMFQYAKRLTPSQQWDKRTIREHFYKNFTGYKNLLAKTYSNESTLKFSPTGNHEKDKLLFRDLLGLSSMQQWRFYDNDTITKEGKKKINDQVVIQRFKSPITFKPIEIEENLFRVYIFCHPIPEEYLGEKIHMNSTKFSKGNPLELKIPEQFDVCEYLFNAITLFILQENDSEYYEDHFKQYVDNSNSEESKYLLDIFSQLNNYYLSKDYQ
ncbi:MAG TPA: hypothetical protein ENN33_05850 [Ignavibacteria bacterium]|nr:hypothetical protein [Ignavibacteria bacterium]